MKRTYIPPKIWEVLVTPELLITAGSGSSNDHADSKENPFIPSLTPIVVESRCYFTFEVLAMNSVSYKFLFF